MDRQEGVIYVKLHKITFVLLVIGGLNWGLKLLGYDLEHFTGAGTLANVVYALVALSAIYEAVMHKKMCRMCMDKGSGSMPM